MSECNHKWKVYWITFKRKFLGIIPYKVKQDYHHCVICNNILVEHGLEKDAMDAIIKAEQLRSF